MLAKGLQYLAVESFTQQADAKILSRGDRVLRGLA
jgi:hypothetical protein